MAETTTKKPSKATASSPAQPRLKQDYTKTYVAELQKELGLANVSQVPVLEKIVLNVGLGKSKDDKKVIEVAGNTLRNLCQKLHRRVQTP
jgi:large subunit ribosomal protein L5